jgi:hypothetical protein
MEKVIDIKIYNDLLERITKGIFKHLWKNEEEIQGVKIKENVATSLLTVLGKTIKTSAYEKYIEKWISIYVSSIAEKGEAIGILAGQSLVQPIVQGVLKSQHSTGKQQAGADTISFIDLNSLRTKVQVIKVHLENRIYDDPKLESEFLSKKYEEVTVGDILISSLGDAKYKPIEIDDSYKNNNLFVYINYSELYSGQNVYRFQLDPNKLDNAGLTHFSILGPLAALKDVMIVLHPLTTFTFDIIPINKPLTSFLEMIRDLMVVKIKGMEGVNIVNQKKITASDVIRRVYYDESTKATHVFLKPHEMMNIPVEKLKSLIKGKLISDETSVRRSEPIMKLVYNGNIEISDDAYHYYYFIGKVTLKTLMEKIAENINMNYLISNNPHEMIEFVGKAAARIGHEYIYSEELRDKPLHYQHICVLTSKIFSKDLTPINPTGFVKSENTSLDTISYQNHTANLSKEIVEGRRGKSKGLTTAIILGSTPNIGTGYIHTRVKEDARKRVIETYARARQDQIYLGKNTDVTFPLIGKLEPVEKLTKPSFKLPNDFEL